MGRCKTAAVKLIDLVVPVSSFAGLTFVARAAFRQDALLRLLMALVAVLLPADKPRAVRALQVLRATSPGSGGSLARNRDTSSGGGA